MNELRPLDPQKYITRDGITRLREPKPLKEQQLSGRQRKKNKKQLRRRIAQIRNGTIG